MKQWIRLFSEKPLLALQQVPRYIWIGVTALGFLWIAAQSPSSTSPDAKAPTHVDTLIPKGFVLVPIQLENYESLDSILGSYGVVDLYYSALESEKNARPLARRIKILRAPRNPSQFAVLAPEPVATLLLKPEGAYYAVVQNPEQTGTDIVTPSPKPKIPKRSVLIFDSEVAP